MNTKLIIVFALLAVISVILAFFGGATPASASELKVGVVLDSGDVNDKGYKEYTLKGAREAAEAAGLEFDYIASTSTTDYEQNIELLVNEGVDLIMTVGFRMAASVAKVARRHPEVRFATIDSAYFPGYGCPDTIENCYTEEGGLSNVSSALFAEDESGYLAGVLAACMNQTGTIASVAGMEVPAVVRFVTGFQHGARSVKPDIVTLNQYIPDFYDPAAGKLVAQGFISQGADIIFAVAGETGNGGLLAAKEAGLMAIGVDVDQYFTYPEVKDVLLTSASKKVDVAAAAIVRDFAAGRLSSGIRMATLANGGVGLAPYHDWEDKIPQACKEKVKAAEEAIKADPTITGGK